MNEILARATAQLAAAFRQGLASAVANAPAARLGRGGKVRIPTAPARRTASRREWPKCSTPGCGKSMFGPSAAARLCYQHYQATGGKHPHQR